MKKLLRSSAATLVLSLVIFTSLTSSVSARIISTEQYASVPEDETIDDDLFIAGQQVSIKGTINGDVYAAGGSIDIEGTVNGDILAAGGTINISGTIRDDLRLGGGIVNIRAATVGDSVTIGAGNVTLDGDSEIGGSLIVGSGTLNTAATIGRNLFAGTGTLSINGNVDKNVLVGSESITIGEDVTIKGSLDYYAQNETALSQNGTVQGETKHHLTPAFQKMDRDDFRGIARRASAGFRVISYLGALLVGFLVIRFFPATHNEIADNYSQTPWACLGWGLLILLALPLVSFFLVISAIGAPLGLILTVLYFIEMYLAKIFTGSVLGQMATDILNLNPEKMNPYLKLALGLAIFHLLRLVPVLNFFVTTGNVIFGMGAMFTYKKEKLFS